MCVCGCVDVCESVDVCVFTRFSAFSHHFPVSRLAFQALQNLMSESAAWKEHVIHGMMLLICYLLIYAFDFF